MAATTPLTIPLTQKAAVLDSPNAPYVVKTDYPVKQPSELTPGEYLAIRKGDWANESKWPIIGGHEGIGRVVAIGEHSQSWVKVGDRVGVKWIGNVCGHCEMCRKGHESSCLVSFTSSHGFKLDGTFQEYMVSFTNYVTPIPEDIDGASAAPILCAGLTVYKAIKQANVSIGQWIAISGAGGGLGHLAVQYAVAMGLRVLAIDTGEVKKKLCLGLGAEKWVDFRESKDLIKDVQAATDDLGPEAAVVAAVDRTPFNQAIKYLRLKGTLVCVGAPAGNALLDVPIALLVAKCMTIIGSSIGNRQDIAEAIRIAALGKVKCQYQIRELEDIDEIFEELQAGKVAGRIVIRF